MIGLALRDVPVGERREELLSLRIKVEILRCFVRARRFGEDI